MNVLAVGSAGFQRSGYAVMLCEVLALMQYCVESLSCVTILTFRLREGDTTLVFDFVMATVVSGEVGFRADLSALGCFSLSCAGSFLSFGKRGLILTTLNLSFRMLNSCCSGNVRKDFKAYHNA